MMLKTDTHYSSNRFKELEDKCGGGGGRDFTDNNYLSRRLAINGNRYEFDSSTMQCTKIIIIQFVKVITWVRVQFGAM